MKKLKSRAEAVEVCREDLLVRMTVDLEERDKRESVAEWLKRRRKHLVGEK